MPASFSRIAASAACFDLAVVTTVTAAAVVAATGSTRAVATAILKARAGRILQTETQTDSA